MSQNRRLPPHAFARARIVGLIVDLSVVPGLPSAASTQDDGARAYMQAPNIDVNLALLRYTHPIAVNGNAGGVIASALF